MTITRLQAENFKRLVAIDITPDGSLIEITGRNGAGKTSVIDAIEWALRGAKAAPEKLVRSGQDEARVVVSIDGLVVTRRRKASGTDYLDVRATDGSKLAGPQEVLDRLFGALTFDPLRFVRMKPNEQAATLAWLAGVDIASHKAKVKAVYDQRTQVGRDRDQAQARVRSILPHPGADVEIDAAKLQDEMQGLMAKREAWQAAQRNKIRANDLLAVARKTVLRLSDDLTTAEADQKDAAKAAEEATKAASEPEPTSEDLARRLREIEEHNKKVAQNRERAGAEAAVKSLNDKYVQMTGIMQAHEDALAASLSNAKLPISGLAIADDTVTMGGIPISDCSGAEKLRLSTAIGLALNPKSKIMLIRDGSLLDSDGLDLIDEMATKAGAQVWLEKVTDGEAVGVCIEDGMVREVAS